MTRLLLLTTLLIFLSAAVHAQRDFIILKKRQTNIQSFVTDSYINFQYHQQQWVTGYIKKIQNDSIYVKQFQLQYVPNVFGTFSVDTFNIGTMRLKINEITAMPRKNQSFNYIKNGFIFQVGGGGYLLLNVVNGLSTKEPIFAGDNIGKLGIAAGVFLLGKILQWNHQPNLRIGKKYHIDYIKL